MITLQERERERLALGSSCSKRARQPARQWVFFSRGRQPASKSVERQKLMSERSGFFCNQRLFPLSLVSGAVDFWMRLSWVSTSGLYGEKLRWRWNRETVDQLYCRLKRGGIIHAPGHACTHMCLHILLYEC